VAALFGFVLSFCGRYLKQINLTTPNAGAQHFPTRTQIPIKFFRKGMKAS